MHEREEGPVRRIAILDIVIESIVDQMNRLLEGKTRDQRAERDHVIVEAGGHVTVEREEHEGMMGVIGDHVIMTISHVTEEY